MLTIGLKTDEQNRTVISCKIDPSAYKRRLYIKNSVGNYIKNANGEDYFAQFSSSVILLPQTIEFIVEDYVDELVSIYPESQKGTLTVELHQLKGIKWEVAETLTQEYPINDNEWNSPQISTVTVSPGTKLLNANGLYVAGKSTVRVTVYIKNAGSNGGGATVSSKNILWSIDGNDYEYIKTKESGLLKIAGTRPVLITITDSRGYKKEAKKEIFVYPYFYPGVSGVLTQAAVSKPPTVSRCDQEGNLSSSGDSLFITAGVNFVSFPGVATNTCTLKYRIKEVGGEWENPDGKVLFQASTANSYYDGKVEQYVNPDKSYVVVLTATDLLGGTSGLSFSIPARAVFMERNGERNSISFFGEITEDNSFEVYNKAIFHGGVEIVNKGWEDLTIVSSFSPLDCGRAGGGARYRMGADGKVAIAFGVSTSSDLTNTTVLLTRLPPEIRPNRQVASICAAGMFDSTLSNPTIKAFSWGNLCTAWIDREGFLYITGLIKHIDISNPNYINAIDGYISYYI